MIGSDTSSTNACGERPHAYTVHQPANDGRYAGLVPLHIRASAEVVDVLLFIDGDRHGSLGPKFTLSEAERVWQGAINSLYLENGPHIITYQLIDADGGSLGVTSVRVHTLNCGELSNVVRDALNRSRSAQLLLPGIVDSRVFPLHSEPLSPWFDREDAIEQISPILARYGLPSDFAKYYEAFIRDGYCEISQLIDQEWCDNINDDLARFIESGEVRYDWGSGNRIDHMFARSEHVRMLWRHPLLLRMLRALFDDEPTACQTLNFIHGSQQPAHQDVISLGTYPVGYMCGVWVALEDIHPDSGPLEIYPGSHRAPAVFGADLDVKRAVPWYDDALRNELATKVAPKMRALAAEFGPPVYYTPRAGSAVIWHSNLLHGGSPRSNPELTRKSLVSHYYARGALAFTDSVGVPALRTLMEVLLAW